MIFGTFKRSYVKTFWFQNKRTPVKYIVELVGLKLVTVVQSFFLAGQCNCIDMGDGCNLVMSYCRDMVK